MTCIRYDDPAAAKTILVCKTRPANIDLPQVRVPTVTADDLTEDMNLPSVLLKIVASYADDPETIFLIVRWSHFNFIHDASWMFVELLTNEPEALAKSERIRVEHHHPACVKLVRFTNVEWLPRMFQECNASFKDLLPVS